MNEQETPEKLDRLIEAGSNPARSTFTPARPLFETMLFHNNQVLMKELVKATFEIADEVNVEELQNIQATKEKELQRKILNYRQKN
jgi:hypothetical protein